MNVAENQVFLKCLNKFYISDEISYDSDIEITMSFVYTMMENGYIPSKNLLNILKTSSKYHIIELQKIFLDTYLLSSRFCFYKNFPEEVMEKSESELYFNAMIHYFINGKFIPEDVSKFKNRNICFEPEEEYNVIDVISDYDEIEEIMFSLLYSKDSISNNKIELLEYFLQNYLVGIDFSKVIHKEILAIINGQILLGNCEYNGVSIDPYFPTTTDILRVLVYLSNGDITLEENSKFKSQPRKIRRILVNALEKVISEEDIKRHYNKWNKAFHCLHIGEYKLAKKCNFIASKNRKSQNMLSFNSIVEDLIKTEELVLLVDKLKERPSEFARRLNEIFTKFPEYEYIIREFSTVISKIPNKILIQLYSNFFLYGTKEFGVRFPKTVNSKMFLFPIKKFDIDYCEIGYIITKLITETLKVKLPENNDIKDKKIYIDGSLKEIYIPFGMRTSSEGKFSLARGSKIKLPDDNTLRFFVHWIGRDIDLSANMYDENFNLVRYINYYSLKYDDINCCHSGDIVDAPNGAAEYIDVDIEKCLSKNIRYIMMHINVFDDKPFDELKECYCGWMTRSFPNSNEIFEPTTIKQKVDVVAHSTKYIPAIFDLKERKMIWADLYDGDAKILGNHVLSMANKSEMIIKAILKERKMNLYKLFFLNGVRNNCTFVLNKEEADYSFGLFEGDVRASDYLQINSKFI